MTEKSPLLLLCAVPALVALFGSAFAQAETLVYQAAEFENLDQGEVPYYLDAGHTALAINAANENYRNKFAEASIAFTKAPGVFDINLVSLRELDGEGDYKLFINDVLVGEFVNEPTDVDYAEQFNLVTGINIPANATIVVSSRSVTNGLIPEGDGTAWARGRLRRLELIRNEAIPEILDLALTTRSLAENPDNQAQQVVTLAVTNSSETVTATGVQIASTLPNNMVWVGSEQCAVNEGTMICVLPEIAPGAAQEVTFITQNTETLTMDLLVDADQVDNALENNNLRLEIVANDGGDSNTDGGQTDGGQTDGGQTDGGQTDGGQTDGGQTDGTGGDTGTPDNGDTGQGDDNGSNIAPTENGGSGSLGYLAILILLGISRRRARS